LNPSILPLQAQAYDLGDRRYKKRPSGAAGLGGPRGLTETTRTGGLGGEIGDFWWGVDMLDLSQTIKV